MQTLQLPLSVAPAPRVVVPASHGVQAPLPGSVFHVPTGHGTHPAPSGAYPRLHTEHSLASLAPRSGVPVPCGHCVHFSSLLMVGLYLP